MTTDLTFPIHPRPGHQCPNCGGMGTNADGMVSFSGSEVRMRHPSKCALCNGRGRVRIVAFTDEEWARETESK